MLGDPEKVGVRDVIERLKKAASSESITPEVLVDICLEILGPIRVLQSTHQGLIRYANRYGSLKWETASQSDQFSKAAVAIIQMIVSSQEYQTA